MGLKGTITTSDYLPYEEYQRLVQCLIDDRDYRGAVYCILSFSMALRISDILKIKWCQILGQKHLTVTEIKTKKTKDIAIGINTESAIHDLYFKLRSPDVGQYIVKSKRSNTISSQYLNRLLKKWKTKYRLNINNFSSHTFRKTFGRYVYNKMGKSEEAIVLLNRIFKHHNIATTMVYLGIKDDEINTIFNEL